MYQNIVLVFVIHWHESAISIQMAPTLESPSPFPSHPTLLGCHRTPDLSSLCHPANSHWLSILHMVIHMFPCHYLDSSHPLPPTLCPPVCSLCLHLHCCPEKESIYICVNIWYLFFWLTTLWIGGPRLIHLTRTDSNVFFLWLSNIPFYICTITSLSIHLWMGI